jgi:hypothetical protein
MPEKEASETEIMQRREEADVQDKPYFSLKRWNLVAMWSWDVECEVCAICRTPLMGLLSFGLV